MELQIIEESDALTHLALVGELDIHGVNAVQDKLYFNVAARRRPSIVDMEGVSFIGSLGIGMLVRVAQSLKRNGARMVLLNPVGKVDEALRLLNLDSVIPITTNLDEAMERIR